jgi:DNA-dependent protein kinase catalytic subunit
MVVHTAYKIISIALRNSQDLLLNVMDIFVKEPLMDWKKIAIKRGKEQSK